MKAQDIERLISFCQSCGLDQDGFLRFLSRKGIAVIAYQALKSCAAADISKLEPLKVFYLTSLTRNTYYLEELIRVLKAFEKEKIGIVPLKGIILSQRLYGDITSRDESVDFDLLVREEDKERARLVLEGMGYSCRQDEAVESWQWCYNFSKPQAKTIELHWDITMMGRNQQRIDCLWQGVEPVEWQGAKYYDFKPEELLLYLSAHLVNSDSFRTLRAICDIRQAIEKYNRQIDWQRIADKANDWGLRGSLYAALTLCQSLFELKFPKQVMRKLKISLPKRFFIRAFADKKVVLRGGIRRRVLDSFLSYILFELIEGDSFKSYFNTFKRVFSPPKETLNGRTYAGRIFGFLRGRSR